MKKESKYKLFLIVYVLFLIWLILFKFNTSIEDIHRIRQVNLRPFYYENVIEGDLPLLEAVFNMVVFIPFGFFVKKVFHNPFYINVIIIFVTSFLFEITQYIFSLGVSDITDLITNTIGGVLGVGIATMLNRKIKKTKS